MLKESWNTFHVLQTISTQVDPQLYQKNYPILTGRGLKGWMGLWLVGFHVQTNGGDILMTSDLGMLPVPVASKG